ncbi:MAG: uroporphyrinogen decarboxylase family protein [Propionivibrio sp.]
MDRRTLVRNAATRKSSDGIIPTFIHFADRVTEQKYANQFGMELSDFRKWIDNDIEDIFLLEDIQMRNTDKEQIAESYRFGFAKDKGLQNAAFDSWGCAWTMDCLGQELRSSPITDIEEVYDYPYPDPNNPDIFHGIGNIVKKIHDKGHAVFIGQNYSLFERAWAMTGYADFLVYCYTDPEAVEYLLARITENKIRIAERICELGTDLGHTGDDYGLQCSGVMSLEMFNKFFKPCYEKIWGVYKKNGIPVMHHSCGDCSMYIPDMIDAGLDMLHTVQQTSMDIRQLSQEYGKDLSFFASIDTVQVLEKGTPDEVRRNVYFTVEHLGKNNGLLLSAINIMPDTPFENVRAAIEQIKSYR